MEMAKAMSGQKTVTPSADGLVASVKAAKPRGRPPVHLWNPPFCGDLDICIRRDGTWTYEGSVFERLELVKLFSSILKKEGDKYFLVTPVEKVGITVEDAPFVAIDFEVEGEGDAQSLTFTTQVGEEVTADADLPLRFERDDASGEPAPYVMVRDDLEALIDRKSFYRLVELGIHQNDWFGVWSGGTFFPIIRSAELAED